MIKSTKNFLKGKKTYVVAITGILTALLAWADGDLSNAETLQTVLVALLGVTLRSGLVNTLAAYLEDEEETEKPDTEKKETDQSKV